MKYQFNGLWVDSTIGTLSIPHGNLVRMRVGDEILVPINDGGIGYTAVQPGTFDISTGRFTYGSGQGEKIIVQPNMYNAPKPSDMSFIRAQLDDARLMIDKMTKEISEPPSPTHLSRRDHFAMAAMTGLAGCYTSDKQVVQLAIQYADALMLELDKK